MIRSAPILALLLAGTATAAEAGRLIGQSQQGTYRVCIYQPDNPMLRARSYQHRVGLAEPCPPRFTPPPPARRTPIPGAAMLIGDRLDGRQRICTYSYAGVAYNRALDQARICPLTPNLLP